MIRSKFDGMPNDPLIRFFSTTSPNEAREVLEAMPPAPPLSPLFNVFRENMTRDISALFGVPRKLIEPRPPSHLSYRHVYVPPEIMVRFDPFLVEPVSDSRSRGRARRRAARGFKQRFVERPRRVFFSLPDGSLVCHPAMWAELQAQLSRQMERTKEELVARVLTGGAP